MCLKSVLGMAGSFAATLCKIGAMARPLRGHANCSRAFAMTTQRALKIVLAISLFGAAFSGTLTYRELTGASAQQCPSPGAPGTILGYPACVYGLAMYLIIASVSLWGLKSGGRRDDRTQPQRKPARNLTPDELPSDI